MSVLSVQNHIIPGYKFLSISQRNVFEKTPLGEELLNLAKKNSGLEHATTQISNFVQEQLWGKYEDDEENNLEHVSARFRHRNTQTVEFQALLNDISYAILLKYYPNFRLLDETQRHLLAQADFSRTLHAIGANNSLTKQQIQELLNHWEKQLGEQTYAPAIFKVIADKKLALEVEDRKKNLPQLQVRADKLAKLSPLATAPASKKTDFTTLLMETYNQEIDEVVFDSRLIELRVLSSVIQHYLELVSENISVPFSKTEFNEKQARLIAQHIINAMNDGSQPLAAGPLLHHYKANLINRVHESVLNLRGHQYQIKDKNVSSFFDSLTYILANNGLNKYISKLAEAHAFLTNTGFSSQNDNIINTVLELYNTNRIREEVSEFKLILGKLLSPLRAFYEELLDIYFFEKSNVAIFIRASILFGMVFGYILLASMFLNPVGLEEVFVAVLGLPIFLYTGLGIASAYITVKNTLYNTCSNWYYGGAYEIPAYQTNIRMQVAFGDKATAQSVRQFYIRQLQACDQLEQEHLRCESRGLLSVNDLEKRKLNLKRRNELKLEWYNIHTNAQVGYDHTRTIFLNRLVEDLDLELRKLDTIWLQKDVQALEISLNANIVVLENSLTGTQPQASPATASSFGFFSANSLASNDRAKAEYLDELIVAHQQIWA